MVSQGPLHSSVTSRSCPRAWAEGRTCVRPSKPASVFVVKRGEFVRRSCGFIMRVEEGSSPGLSFSVRPRPKCNWSYDLFLTTAPAWKRFAQMWHFSVVTIPLEVKARKKKEGTISRGRKAEFTSRGMAFHNSEGGGGAPQLYLLPAAGSPSPRLEAAP